MYRDAEFTQVRQVPAVKVGAKPIITIIIIRRHTCSVSIFIRMSQRSQLCPLSLLYQPMVWLTVADGLMHPECRTAVQICE